MLIFQSFIIFEKVNISKFEQIKTEVKIQLKFERLVAIFGGVPFCKVLRPNKKE